MFSLLAERSPGSGLGCCIMISLRQKKTNNDFNATKAYFFRRRIGNRQISGKKKEAKERKNSKKNFEELSKIGKFYLFIKRVGFSPSTIIRVMLPQKLTF